MSNTPSIEKVQRRASKYILGDRGSDYRSRLITLNLLPLMYWLELQDLIFCVKSLQSPSDNFNIRNYVQFSTSSTRSSGCKLLYKTSCSSTTRHFYLNRIVLLWNASPPIDISLSLVTIKRHLTLYMWNYFLTHFNPANTCTYHYICPCPSCRPTNTNRSYDRSCTHPP